MPHQSRSSNETFSLIFRFFFKKASDEFDSGVVHEEITDDEAFLPKWQGKVVGKVEVKH